MRVQRGNILTVDLTLGGLHVKQAVKSEILLPTQHLL
jgi:hypothetical protein